MFIMWDHMLHKLAQNNKRVHTHAFYIGTIGQYYIPELSKRIWKLLHTQKQSKRSCFTITTFKFIRKNKPVHCLKLGPTYRFSLLSHQLSPIFFPWKWTHRENWSGDCYILTLIKLYYVTGQSQNYRIYWHNNLWLSYNLLTVIEDEQVWAILGVTCYRLCNAASF